MVVDPLFKSESRTIVNVKFVIGFFENAHYFVVELADFCEEFVVFMIVELLQTLFYHRVVPTCVLLEVIGFFIVVE